MGLVLCNAYPARMDTSIMFYSPETCGGDGGDFEMMGWWSLAPGACARVFANDLADQNQFWYFFAMADDGAVWAGPFVNNVPLTAFAGNNSCWGTGRVGPRMIRIGYRELDIGDSDNFTLTFVP